MHGAGLVERERQTVRPLREALERSACGRVRV